MTNKIKFHFTMGPVQGFVSQSRRTRDLWASSYLLSHLAEKAIRAVAELDGAKIILPAFEPNASRDLKKDEVPHGTYPNRFVAEVTSLEQAKLAGQTATAAVREEWKQIAEQVWTKFVEPVAEKDKGVREIWDRQIANFWDINWVAGSEGNLLDRRKNWRTRPAVVEPGEHCTMMSDLQELSGLIRGKKYAKSSRGSKQNYRFVDDHPFWTALGNRVGQLDLGPDERLSAIALVKRLYPKAGLEQFKDLNVSAWSSTLYLAAVPWLIDLLDSDDQKKLDAARDYVKTIEDNTRTKTFFGERDNAIPKLKGTHEKSGGFSSLDGNFFYKTALDNQNATPLGFGDDEIDKDREARDAILRELSKLYEVAGSKPSPFYALLLMDGDSMGQLITEAGDRVELVSKGLTKFTGGVPKIVQEHQGVTVYAGGDDVLAMLPACKALTCAIELEKKYAPSFDDALKHKATISGAIVFAHYRVPLRTVLATAHHLLDDVAKEETGRASLAIGVLKSTGLNCQWSAPWEYLKQGDQSDSNIISRVVDEFRGKDGKESELSSSFFYNIRERFALLTDRPLYKPGVYGNLIENLDFVDVLVADYLRGRERQRDGDGNKAGKEQALQDARQRMEVLLAISQRVRRKDGRVQAPETNTLGIDGALLVRFLASEGKEIDR